MTTRADEIPVDPEIPLWDAHHHLYPGDGRPRYLIDELKSDLGSGHQVIGTTFVETSGHGYRDTADPLLAPVGETEWVASLSDGRVPGAIIGYANMMAGAEVGKVLDAHEAAGRGLFRGIRFRRQVIGQADPPDHFHMSEPVRRAATELLKRGWVYESSFPSRELPEFRVLARRVPEQIMVVNHLGGPVRQPGIDRTEMMRSWRSDMRRLALCENVVLKIGGVGMRSMTPETELAGPPDSSSVSAFWREPILEAIEFFGVARCMFESNFPVDGQLLSYRALWNTYKLIVQDFTTAEREYLFFRTAHSTYRIGNGETEGPTEHTPAWK